ncbi:MAG: glycosyltransferase [Oscillospiraceae bacterium]|nr:glycosyltransferase [Oscillospiraceae bacterium]
MKIIQFLPVIAFGDAVGNDTAAVGRAIADMGYETGIYAEVVDGRLPAGTARDLSGGMPEMEDEDILIYHLSTGSKLNYEVTKYNCRKIMIYHNITPPHFFSGYNESALVNCTEGLRAKKDLADKFDYCIADSAFNKRELEDAGYKCRIDVRPILIPFEDYEKKPDKNLLARYKDGFVNIVFVGRIAPNKKHEDIISAFCYYKKHINKNSRLILAGSYTGFEKYYERLQKYVRALELEDVVFTGHIKFPGILAVYSAADIFLCMSEHEGFCVPLTEAMFFKVPIIAYDSCAVPDTLGGSGVLLDKKDPVETALMIDKVVSDKALHEAVIKGQSRRLEDFAYERVRGILEKQLKGFINGDDPERTGGEKL